MTYNNTPGWGNSTADYYLRQFRSLPAGYIATTEQVKINTGWIDAPLNTYTPMGLGVCATGKIGDAFKVKVPSSDIEAAQFCGILVHDHTIVRDYFIQPKMTYISQELVPVLREGTVRVFCDSAVTVTDNVYLIFTTSGSEIAGHFKAGIAAGTNSRLVKNAKWLETKASAGIVTLEVFNVYNN